MKKRKKFRCNEDLFRFLNKYKEHIKNIEVYIDDIILVKYDKM